METETGIYDLKDFQNELENYDPINPEKMADEDGSLLDEIWEAAGNLKNQEKFYKVAKAIAPEIVSEIISKMEPVSVGNDMIKKMHLYSSHFDITVNIDDPGYKDGILLDVRSGYAAEKLYLYNNVLFLERTVNAHTTFDKYEFIG